VLPLYAALAGAGASRSFARRPWLCAGCVALAAALPVVDLATRIPELRANAVHRRALAPLAQALAERAHTVALLDVGYLGYASGVRVVDLGGLTDPVIARMPGGHLTKRIDPRYLRERNPDTLVLHTTARPRLGPHRELRAFSGYPVELRVAAMPFVRDGFIVREVIEYAPAYSYLVLERAGSWQESVREREQRHPE
jgi:hypothetical protein